MDRIVHHEEIKKNKTLSGVYADVTKPNSKRFFHKISSLTEKIKDRHGLLYVSIVSFLE